MFPTETVRLPEPPCRVYEKSASAGEGRRGGGNQVVLGRADECVPSRVD